MKKTALALATLMFIATAVGFAGGRDEPSPIVGTGLDFDGSTLTVYLENTSSEPATATLTVYFMSNGSVVDTLTAPVSLAGGGAGSILFTITDDLNPFEYIQFGID
jgi:hypothetical protein